MKTTFYWCDAVIHQRAALLSTPWSIQLLCAHCSLLSPHSSGCSSDCAVCWQCCGRVRTFVQFRWPKIANFWCQDSRADIKLNVQQDIHKLQTCTLDMYFYAVWLWIDMASGFAEQLEGKRCYQDSKSNCNAEKHGLCRSVGPVGPSPRL